MYRRGSLIAAAALGGAVLVACSSTGPEEDEPIHRADVLSVQREDALVLLTQNSDPSVGMEALFRGSIELDALGCLRTESTGSDRPTVVWPHGYRAVRVDDGRVVLDAEGDVVGRIGGEFVLAGGLVDALPSSLGFTDADRQLADEHCPGRYWFVNDP